MSSHSYLLLLNKVFLDFDVEIMFLFDCRNLTNNFFNYKKRNFEMFLIKSKLPVIMLAYSTFLQVNTASAGAMGPIVEESKWTGIYAGVNLGAAVGVATLNSTATNFNGVNGSPTPGGSSLDAQYAALSYASLNPASGLVGLQLGYNWQLNHIVLGLETNFDYMQQTNSGTKNTPLSTGAEFRTDSVFSTSWIYTIRPRLGYLLYNNFLVFGTGGFSLTNPEYRIFTQYSAPTTGVTSQYGSFSFASAQVGWNAGGGIEWMFSNRWILNAQYLFNDFGTLKSSQTYNNHLPTSVTTIKSNGSLKEQLITVGINYLFG